ncbi:MAG: UvrD-helicase domain-containing protein [Solirubrobacteraceae bacterium]
MSVLADAEPPAVGGARGGPPGSSKSGAQDFTPEQLDAIVHRGDLLLDAAAGSGKTSVLVERFVRAVLRDEIEVNAILTITFTEKAAGELRDRIRMRLRELGGAKQARATEDAFISTIHGFCARVLRAHALAAGLDPAFSVLDQPDAERLAAVAFDEALEDLAQNAPGAIDLVAAHGPGVLRGAILACYGELRSRGDQRPELPPLPAAPDPRSARLELGVAASRALAELTGLADPSGRVVQALERLARCAGVIEGPDPWPWPGELGALRLPKGNGAALSTPACLAYGEALQRFRRACEHRWAGQARELLDRLLRGFGERYAQRKRECSGLDFEDLELLVRELLRSDPELREHYAGRFEQIMVDELQDVNPVQLELIESIARANLFTVGDAQQSIYGFRHAEVELFQRRGERLAALGARRRLKTNFRSRREILDAVNLTFAGELGESFNPLQAGRGDPTPESMPGPRDPRAESMATRGDPRVELLIVDKGAGWAADGLASPWRLAEARALAQRVRELIEAGVQERDVVVLTRASTDLRVYERALEDRAVATYVIGGRGYWSHPQVVDLVAYLRALANPRDEEALYTVLASPLLGVSLDALVVLGAAARAAARDPWWVLGDPQGRLDELAPVDRGRLVAFGEWFAAERVLTARIAVEELIERALVRTEYDLAMLAMPGGRRRLANVRKLMRLGREHEAACGPDLRGFLELVANRAAEGSPAQARESEAPVESEALQAVRLMTVHRAKGLEFEIVCVADLGRGPRRRADLLRIGRDGRLGLRLAQPGTGRREPALDYDALGDEQQRREEREERRLFYVAMTRARERLILSGAARLDPWPERCAGSPVEWIAPALVPGIAELAGDAARGAAGSAVIENSGDAVRGAAGPSVIERSGVAIRLSVVGPEDVVGKEVGGEAVDPGMAGTQPPGPLPPGPLPSSALPPGPLPPAEPAPPVSRLSYSLLVEYQRCGYRFYAERCLCLPPVGEGGGSCGARTAGSPGARTAGSPDARRRVSPEAQTTRMAGARTPRLTAADRGVLVHDLLATGFDFRRPRRPTAALMAAAAQRAGVERRPSIADVDELAGLVDGFAASELCARLARARDVRREERFGYSIDGGVLLTGALDVLARESGEGMLVVDYKSDRLQGADPTTVLETAYATQRLVYALAALRAGAQRVEVVHVFLERANEPLAATFARADTDRLEGELATLTRGVLAREFEVSNEPHRALCGGCPAEGGLCSWPPAMTRREAPDRLF